MLLFMNSTKLYINFNQETKIRFSIMNYTNYIFDALRNTKKIKISLKYWNGPC